MAMLARPFAEDHSMTTPEHPTPATKKCPECGILVVHLAKHLKKAHDTIKNAERLKQQQALRSKNIAEKNVEIIEKARLVFLSTKIKCTVCQEQIPLKLISEHFFSKHKAPLTIEMRALYGLAEHKNMFKTSKEREEYWKVANGIEPRGDDIYDRGMTRQGGAFGLGKNRKH